MSNILIYYNFIMMLLDVRYPLFCNLAFITNITMLRNGFYSQRMLNIVFSAVFLITLLSNLIYPLYLLKEYEFYFWTEYKVKLMRKH